MNAVYELISAIQTLQQRAQKEGARLYLIDSDGDYNNFKSANLETSGAARIIYHNEFGVFNTELSQRTNQGLSFIRTPTRISILGLDKENFHIVAH